MSNASIASGSAHPVQKHMFQIIICDRFFLVVFFIIFSMIIFVVGNSYFSDQHKVTEAALVRSPLLAFKHKRSTGFEGKDGIRDT